MAILDDLERTGYYVCMCSGVSMMPLLRQNRDVLIISRNPSTCYRVFDIVLFIREDGTYVLHRILKRKRGIYWVVGDNCYKGEYIREDQVIGSLTQVIRNGKAIRFDSLRYKLYLYLWCAPYQTRFILLDIYHNGWLGVRHTWEKVCKRIKRLFVQ